MPSSDAISPNQATEIAARGSTAGDSLGDKLLREVDLIAGGTVSGTKESWQAAIDRPGESLLKVSSAALIAGGLALAQKRTGVVGLGAQIAAGALGISFLTDVNGRMGVTWNAIGDSWQSAENHEHNKRVLGQTVGSFIVDSGLFMAGGAAGAGIARGGAHLLSRGRHDVVSLPVLQQSELASKNRSSAFALEPAINLSSSSKVPVDRSYAEVELPGLQPGLRASAHQVLSVPREAPLAQLYRQAVSSVGKVEVIAGRNQQISGEIGTGFAISKDGKVATAFHVVQDALSVSIFDAAGRPHSARIASSHPERDIAILQLERESSFAAFKPLELGGQDTGVVAAFGHPNGWNRMFASPGHANAGHPAPGKARYEMHAEHGNSGSPIVDLDGRAVAVLIQSPRSGTSTVYGTPIKYVTQLAERTTTQQFTNAGTRDELLAQSKTAEAWIVGEAPTRYTIADAEAALANIKSLFGPDVFGIRPVDFFHSKVKRVEVQAPSTVVLKTEFNPADREIVVRPIALNDAEIPSNLFWPSSISLMRDAQLRLRLDGNFRPLYMESVHDPLFILPRAFDFRGQNNYLSVLRPDKVTRN